MLTARSLPDGRMPVLISAHAADLVRAEAVGLLDYLRTAGAAAGVAAVADTLHRLRPVRRHRAVVRAGDTAELQVGLAAVASGAEHPLVSRSQRSEPVRTAFVFPGQGSEWAGMGAELLDVPAYRDEAHRCAEAFRRAGRASPLHYLSGAESADPVLVQAAQFTHAAALAATWRSWGVLPDLTVGHSLGELAAAYTAGAVDLDDAAAVVIARAVLTDSAPGRFGMAMLSLGPDDAAALIAEVDGWLELSAVNGPMAVVVAGELAAVRDAVRRADRRGVFARELSVGYPAHTSALTPLRDQLVRSVPAAQFHRGPVEFIGSVLGGPVPPGTDFRQYWYDNLRRPVRFDLAAAAAVARGATTFIEMSAHPALLIALADTAGDAQLLGSARRDRSARDELAANLAAAAVADPGYRWRDFAGPATRAPLRRFPPAPMRAVTLWAGAEPSPTGEPTTMTEHWLPADPPPGGPGGSVAVLDYSGQAGRLAAKLAATLRNDPRIRLVDAAAAELLVLVAPPADTTDIAVATRTFADQASAQAATAPAAGCRTVWLVTVGAEQIGTDPVPRPVPAALAALHRSVGFGYPDQTFAHLDLPAEYTAADLGAVVPALLGGETEIAVRAGQLVARRLRRCAPAAAGMVPETVVITGGTGAIGLAYAAFCAEHGARDIVLLSRRGAAGAAAARLDAVAERTGAAITAISCDLTDADAIRAAVRRHRPAPAALVVHTASAPALPSTEFSADAVREAFGAKVIGLDHLVRNWPLRPNARVQVCSSVLALWGGSGHGLYAAANRMADVLAGRLRSRGLAVSSIRWGLWQTVAVVTGVEQDRIARVGLVPMAPDAAIAAGLSAPSADPVILAADWQRLAVFFDSQGVPSPFCRPATGTVRSSGGGPQRPLEQVVAAELAAVLGLDPADQIDPHRSLTDLGLDSLLALDLRNRLGRVIRRRVELGALLSGITAAELVGLLDPAETDTGKERVHHD